MAVATADGVIIGAGSRSEVSGAEEVPAVHRRPRSSLKPVAWVPKDDIDRDEWEAQGPPAGLDRPRRPAAEMGLRTCDVAEAHLRTLLSTA
jgi:hypothetical protein